MTLKVGESRHPPTPPPRMESEKMKLTWHPRETAPRDDTPFIIIDECGWPVMIGGDEEKFYYFQDVGSFDQKFELWAALPDFSLPPRFIVSDETPCFMCGSTKPEMCYWSDHVGFCPGRYFDGETSPSPRDGA